MKNTDGGNTQAAEAEELNKQDFRMEDFCKEAISLLLMAYLFVIFAMFPFYMQNGYVEIGRSKYFLYRDVTIGAFCLIIPLAVLGVILRCVREKRVRLAKKLSVTDWAVLLYGISVLASYLLSDFQKDALWGENGWYMGLITQLLFVLSYFLVSRFWEYDTKILYAAMLASAAVFLLGLLNRFSIYPFAVEGANNGFISTMGNINWYCGYWAVFFPMGVMLYWFADKLHLRLAGLLLTAVGTATGVSQGSNSAFLVFGGVYLLLFCLSFRDGKRMQRFLELLILSCLVCQGLRFYRILFPVSFNYYEGSFCDWITRSSLSLYALVPLAFLYLLLILNNRKSGGNMARYKMLRQITLLLLTITAGVYVFLLTINTMTEGGIRFMGEVSVLRFNILWGSSRGGTWKAGVDLFQKLPWEKKLTGVGPDSFAMYLYSLPDIRKVVMKQFGQSRLTNAHNEWLSVLVNNGIFGLISYAGIFVSAVTRFLYRAERSFNSGFLYLFAASVFAYTLHNMVSFQQILSTPFIFLLLAIGERYLRERQGSS